jgi:hypothetical protein
MAAAIKLFAICTVEINLVTYCIVLYTNNIHPNTISDVIYSMIRRLLLAIKTLSRRWWGTALIYLKCHFIEKWRHLFS